MKNNAQVQPSPEAVETSQDIWSRFVFVSQICGGVIAALLIIMAIFLV